MKKIRGFILILAAVLTFFTGINAEAAATHLEAGTKKASVTMTLKDLMSLEGEVTGSAPSGATITVSSMKAAVEGEALCSMVGNRIFMVSSGKAVTVTITMEVEFSADGTYAITLDGGRTDAQGKYEDYTTDKDKYVDKLTINVGEASDSSAGSGAEDNADDSGDDNDDDSNGDDNNDAGTSDSNTSIDNSATQDAGGADTNGTVDYSALEQALSDANAAISSNEELKSMQNLLDKTNEAAVLLGSDDQSKIDEAALEIQKGLEELGEEIVYDKEEADAFTSGLGSIFKNTWKFLVILLLLLVMVAAIIIGIWLWNKVGKGGPDYVGAPDVDYDINEDDE